MAQLKMLKDPKVWRYCQYYSVVFGGYVGLSLWMVKYYVTEYGFDIKSAALLAACFLCLVVCCALSVAGFRINTALIK
jgi:NNP family nitrate/nitrite transporter-like MFS transporter